MNEISLLCSRIFLLLIVSMTSPLTGQDTGLPFSSQPKLQELFDDTFQSDTQHQYKVAGEIDRAKGRISIKSGGSIYRQFNAGSWIELELDVEIRDAKSGSFTRVWLDLDEATDSFVEFRQTKINEKQAFEISIVDSDGNFDEKTLHSPVAHKSVDADDLASATLFIQYRYGLWTVRVGNGSDELVGYIENGSAQSVGVRIECKKQQCKIDRLRMRGTPGITYEPSPKAAAKLDQLEQLLAEGFAAYENRDIQLAIRKLSAANKGLVDQIGRYNEKVAAGFNDIAFLHMKSGELLQAEKKHRQSLHIRQALYGERHPNVVKSLINLAAVYSSTGMYDKAEPLFLRAQKILKATLGTQNLTYTTCLINLGHLYENMGEFRKARPLFLEAVKVTELIVGRDHIEFVENLNHLAGINRKLGLFDEAEQALKQVLKISEKIFNGMHPIIVLATANLASLYQEVGRNEEALALYEETLVLTEKIHGKHHFRYAKALYKLGDYYLFAQQNKKAVPYYEEAIEFHNRNPQFRQKFFGDMLNNFASLYYSRSEFEEAEKLFRRALEFRERELGTSHPLYSAALLNLCITNIRLERLDTAEKLAARAVEIHQRKLDQYSIIQTEAEQLKLVRASNATLSLYLTIARMLPSKHRRAFEYKLAQKGSVLGRQKRYRELATRNETAELFEQLSEVVSELAHLSNQPSISSSGRLRAKRLQNRMAVLEKQIAEVSGGKAKNAQSVNLEDFVRSLPSNSVLISFDSFLSMDLADETLRSDFKNRLAAFVVRRSKAGRADVTMLDLGDSDLIESLVSAWRKPIADSTQFGRAITASQQKEMDASARKLRECIWDPLVPLIKPNDLVIVSPDGPIGKFPLIALPGSKPNTYLLEEHRLVTIPVPRQLPDLLAQTPKRINSQTNALIAGDIDYGSPNELHSPNQLLATRGNGQGMNFGKLTYTGIEAASVADRFPNSILLTAGKASESTFKKRIHESRLLHIATHAFFKAKESGRHAHDQKIESVRSLFVDPTNPNLLSGIAFANANLARDSIANLPDDGILYSAEIAMLPMNHVELAVLSACETGLGTIEASGEGLVGIQRAFQIAGARSTIASYWKVDDRATQLLMTRFYQNLIDNSNPEKANKLDTDSTIRIDALRDAQLWMLNHSSLAKSIPRGRPIKIDPATIKPKPKDESRSNGPQSRTHPMYWAAFELSGDWR